MFACFILQQSYFYPCTASANGKTDWEWMLHYRKIDTFEAPCYQAGPNEIFEYKQERLKI